MARKTTVKSAPKAAAAKRTPARPRIQVRMYRQGLGDCFLLTIPKGSGRPFYMLIDCGVVLGTPDAESEIRKVVEDVKATTEGRIDLLVATHEHWDHISAFVQVPELFSKFTIDSVWLAWTEDPKDGLAAKLRKERRSAENALRMAAQHLALAGAAETHSHVDSLVSFFGAKAGSTQDAMEFVKKLGAGTPRYCRPGEPPIHVSGLPGVRFWVLGPPKDEKLIKKSNPGKGEGYGLDAGPGGTQSNLVAILTRGMGAAGDSAVLPPDPSEEPFDDIYVIPAVRAEHIPFFQQRYYGDSPWRRIENLWMDASETMALQLDSATNNTSLVLAIELTDTGEILLFPGDAQAGNWLSWQDLNWEIDDPASGKKVKVTGPDLLARTILYKVGHHGSHNATLKAKGLELMLNESLIAMIPVDHEMARKKGWGKMPLPDLVERVKTKTHARFLRIDDDAEDLARFQKLRPEAKWAKDQLTVTKLYFELTL